MRKSILVAAAFLALAAPAAAEELKAMKVGKAYIAVPVGCLRDSHPPLGGKRCVEGGMTGGQFVTLADFQDAAITRLKGYGSAANPDLGVNYILGPGFAAFADDETFGNRKAIKKSERVAASRLPDGVSACISYLFDQAFEDGAMRETGLYCATRLDDGKGSAVTTVASVTWMTIDPDRKRAPASFDKRAAAILSTFKRK